MNKRLIVECDEMCDKDELVDYLKRAMFTVLEDQIPNIYGTEYGLELLIDEQLQQGDVDVAIEDALEERFGDWTFEWKWEYERAM